MTDSLASRARDDPCGGCAHCGCADTACQAAGGADRVRTLPSRRPQGGRQQGGNTHSQHSYRVRAGREHGAALKWQSARGSSTPDILEVAALVVELGQPRLRLLRSEALVLAGEVNERGLDVLGHLRASAHVQLGTLLHEQAYDLLTLLGNLVLHIHLLRLLTREGEASLPQHAVASGLHELLLVNKIVFAVLAAKEEIVLSELVTLLLAEGELLDKATNRCQARAWADHDQRRRGVARQLERRVPDEDLRGLAHGVREQVVGAHALELAIRELLALNGAGDVDCVGVRQVGGGDGVVPRLHAREELQELRRLDVD
mmetsp:Transcript_21135/g.49512  ORF Transcript_21135/g.49512 Transcript_21135/m.49512 type:complete len:316 (+) Transcript_21135:619-1566(+)